MRVEAAPTGGRERVCFEGDGGSLLVHLQATGVLLSRGAQGPTQTATAHRVEKI